MAKSQPPNEAHYEWKRPRGKTRLSPLKLDVYLVVLEAALQDVLIDLDAICSRLPRPARTSPRRHAVERALEALCRLGLVAQAKTIVVKGEAPTNGGSVAQAGHAVEIVNPRTEAGKAFHLTGAGCAAAKQGQFDDLNPEEMSVVKVFLAPLSSPCSRWLTSDEIAQESGLSCESVNQSINTLAAAGWIS